MTNSKQGAIASLLLTFLVCIIVSLILFGLVISAYLGVKRSLQAERTQQAFLVAEGILYETVQHIRNPALPELMAGLTEYNIDGARIRRTIIRNAGEYRIEINVDLKGTRRKLVATYGTAGENRPNLDIILVIDNSQSMSWGGVYPNRPIDHAKKAARLFVDLIEAENFDDQIGLVTFSDEATLKQGLTARQNFNTLRLAISNISPLIRTNIGHGLEIATRELNSRARADSTKVIILLSDGVANKYSGNVCTGICEGAPCFRCINLPCPSLPPGQLTGYKPDDGGTCCTNYAAQKGQEAKANNYIIFSIMLTNYENSMCSDVARTALLGRLTALRISSQRPDNIALPPPGGNYTFYKETGSSSDLEAIYNEIAEYITSADFFQYQEVAPEPI